jgi:putative tryptophan/tyrosine transport system substrate-binding protein
VISRRTFLGTVIGGLIAAPRATEAQQSTGIRRIGILTPAAVATGPPYEEFREALRGLGYIEGTNIALEFRLAGGKVELLPELAADLVRLKVDVIVTDGGEPSVRAAMNATKTIPIVMGTGPDPVASGLVPSLARPGGNVTGLTLPYADFAGKRLQLLKEAVPRVTRIAVLWDQANATIQFRATEAAARPLGVQLQSLPVRGPADFDGAFEAARRGRVGALLLLASRVLFEHRSAIVDRALKHRLPGLFEPGFAEVGGLMSYGPSVPDNFRRVAVYVDKILKGAKPADLPFEEPSIFRLVINLKTAKALGLTIPPSLLSRADEVIQ